MSYGPQGGADHRARGARRWLVRIYLGRDPESKKRQYHSHTVHGPVKQAQIYLTKKLRER